MSWHGLSRGSLTLSGFDSGAGLPVVFQHGLGGSEAQVAEVFPDNAGVRRLTLDCRGQGRSPIGRTGDLSIETFAADVLSFARARGVTRFVAGGISMGAAIALRLAVRHPENVAALILARPAWLWDAAPENMQPYAEVATFLRNPDKGDALAGFEGSATGRRLAREAPDNLASMRNFLASDERDALADLLSAIAGDGPGISEQEVRAIAVPTLVIGNRADIAHPFAYAETLASAIAGAELIEITPKAADRPRHVEDFRAAVAAFLSKPAVSKGMHP